MKGMLSFPRFIPVYTIHFRQELKANVGSDYEIYYSSPQQGLGGGGILFI